MSDSGFVVEVGVGFLVIAEAPVAADYVQGALARLPLALDKLGCLIVTGEATGTRQAEVLHSAATVGVKLKDVAQGREMTADHAGARQFLELMLIVSIAEGPGIGG